MARRAATVTQTDIKRAVCAMNATGVKVYGVRLDAGGVTILTNPVEAAQPSGEAKNAAEVFDAWLKEQGDGAG